MSTSKGIALSVPLKDILTQFQLVAPQATYNSQEGWDSLIVLDIECRLIENVVMRGSKEKEDLLMSVDIKM